MYKRIIKKLKYINSQFEKIDRSLPIIALNSEIGLKNDQIQFDLDQINQLFVSGEYVPFTRWSMSPSTIAHILNDIIFNSRQNVVEFGLGASTFYIAKIIEKLDLGITFVSIESDEVWKDKVEVLLKRYGLLKYVKILLAPISEVPEDMRLKSDALWYNFDDLKEGLNYEKPFDLIIVDGPWGGLCRYSRYPAIPFLQSNLSKNSTIFLDDTFRTEEKEILELWIDTLKLESSNFNKYSIISNLSEFKLESLPINKWIK